MHYLSGNELQGTNEWSDSSTWIAGKIIQRLDTPLISLSVGNWGIL